MKTNTKFSRISPAFAFITPENFSLEFYHSKQYHVLDSSIYSAAAGGSVESKIAAALGQLELDPGRLIIILSADLTLYSEQVFPSDLSDAQIDELLALQLSKGLRLAGMTTYYDYFPLNNNKESTTYGLIEARKDVLNKWIDGFRNIGLETVAIVSEPIVLLNYMLENNTITMHAYQLVCLLHSRIYVACIEDDQIEKITEQVTPVDSFTADSMANLIMTQLDADSHGLTLPTIILDTLDCGVTQALAEALGNIISSYPNFRAEKTRGQNTIKWLRTEDDMYQSVAMA